MAIVSSFEVDNKTMDIRMYAGDTGSFKFTAKKDSGDDWTDEDRMLFTVANSQGEIVMQRIYRLDDQWNLGNGAVMIEFHNSDTDEWDPGIYSVEVRFNFPPVWEGTTPTARCVNALTSEAQMVEGANVRTKIKSTLEIKAVSGRI